MCSVLCDKSGLKLQHYINLLLWLIQIDVLAYLFLNKICLFDVQVRVPKTHALGPN